MTGRDLSVYSGHKPWIPGILARKRDGSASVAGSVSTGPMTSVRLLKNHPGDDISCFTIDGEQPSTVVERPTQFLVECEGGEMVFVTTTQCKSLQRRCTYFRNIFTTGSQELEERLVKKPEWSVAVTRRLIELLTTGAAWIENDPNSFAELSSVAADVSVSLRLCSMINFHDVLDDEETEKFFRLVHIDNYQFKIEATVKSWQWIELLRQGILLLLKSKVIMVKTGMDLPDKNGTSSRVSPSGERLAKCDTISSEFCVYANGKVNALLKILEILRPPPTVKDAPPRGQNEMYRITYMTRIGELSKDDMDMVWRMSAASYTGATPDERKYLETKGVKSKSGAIVTMRNDDDTASSSAQHHSNTSSKGSTRPGESITTSSQDHTSGDKDSLVSSTSTTTSSALMCRTITCHSFLVLKHIFEPINKDNTDLPATLIINAPTPDTLGRLINARSRCGDTCNDLGMDIDEDIFFVARTTDDIKLMLSYLSDYSTSAVVTEDFRLVEFRTPSHDTTAKSKSRATALKPTSNSHAGGGVGKESHLTSRFSRA